MNFLTTIAKILIKRKFSLIWLNGRRSGCLLLLMLAPLVQAQFMESLFSPKVRVSIKHPPGLPLKAERIVFAPSGGKCSAQVLQAITSDLLSSGIEIIDRQNIALIFAEQNMSLTHRIDPATAIKIGKIIGPSVLLSVQTLRCTDKQETSYKSIKVRISKDQYEDGYRFYATTQVFLKLSVQASDLATGRIFAARVLEYDPMETQSSTDGFPVYPEVFDLLDQAIRSATWEVHKMFVPWAETKELVFYKNKRCNLRNAYQTLQAGLIEHALEISKDNVEECTSNAKSKPKVLAQAYYNLGMTYRITAQFDLALENFRQAMRFRPGDLVSRAISNTIAAKKSALALQAMETDASLKIQDKEMQQEMHIEAQEKNAITNASIITMANQGLPVSIILKLIDTSECRFNVTGGALAKLYAAKVSEAIILRMIDKAKESH